MRTFGILVSGWLAGGLIVVILAGGDRVDASTSRVTASEPEVRATEPLLVETLIVEPVAAPVNLMPSPESMSLEPVVVEPENAFIDAPLVIPVAGITADRLRDSFSEARAGHTHRALDIMAPRGTPVLASVDGTIRKLFNSRAGGITIYQFDLAEKRVYYYAHLDRYARGIREGMRVKRGDVIGYVGTTGNAPARSPHLHFAIEQLTPTKQWWKGEPLNPYSLLTSNGVTLAP